MECTKVKISTRSQLPYFKYSYLTLCVISISSPPFWGGAIVTNQTVLNLFLIVCFYTNNCCYISFLLNKCWFKTYLFIIILGIVCIIEVVFQHFRSIDPSRVPLRSHISPDFLFPLKIPSSLWNPVKELCQVEFFTIHVLSALILPYSQHQQNHHHQIITC